ncbi:hypothetical protein BHM03_00019886 [Ensete ventricosum]|uniref:Uncharacterized protein n=1 Tax=Ensete ventricosum TaxID=4639 RepID=A0A426YBN4_ENSVE|nr:hypothetical protein B296_00048350 [Ensete ventricosum]RZR91713.1 hypothetical protein BHM03_00019886 [Ensete ventricosum]
MAGHVICEDKVLQRSRDPAISVPDHHTLEFSDQKPYNEKRDTGWASGALPLPQAPWGRLGNREESTRTAPSFRHLDRCLYVTAQAPRHRIGSGFVQMGTKDERNGGKRV